MYDDNFIIVGEDVDETEEIAVAKRTSSECLYLIAKGSVRYRIVATTTARVGREWWSKTNDVHMTINNECVGIDWWDGDDLVAILSLKKWTDCKRQWNSWV